MSVFTLPKAPANTQFFDQRLALDEVDYIFTFRFNTRRNLWTFSMVGPDDEPVVSGQTVYTGVDFLRRSVAVSKPPGILTALSTNGDASAPGELELGERVEIHYLDAAELGRT